MWALQGVGEGCSPAMGEGVWAGWQMAWLVQGLGDYEMYLYGWDGGICYMMLYAHGLAAGSPSTATSGSAITAFDLSLSVI